MKYVTYFKLTDKLKDLNAAIEYLKADDFTIYLKSDSRLTDSLKSKIDKLDWILKDESLGYIYLTTNTSLSNDELSQISNWVDGFNSDGLSFSDQDFACYEDEGLTGYEGSEWDNVTIKSMIVSTTNFKFQPIND